MPSTIRRPSLLQVSLSSFDSDLALRYHQTERWWTLPAECHPKERVTFDHAAHVAVGDLDLGPATGIPEQNLTSYRGPLMLIGQDILVQRNLLFDGQGKQMLFGEHTGRKGQVAGAKGGM